MLSKLLLLLVLVPPGGWCSTKPDKMSLRDYCDDYVYRLNGFPSFPKKPLPYALGYYKRCINHDMWVECILTNRAKPPEKVGVEDFEKGFPGGKGMVAAGIVFCLMELQRIPATRQTCHFNTTMCNHVYETKDKCTDAYKKVICLWGQYSKCGYDQMLPIKRYELGLLGGNCLVQQKEPVYPHTRTVENCVNGATALRGPSSILQLLTPMSMMALALALALGSCLAHPVGWITNLNC